MKVLLVSLCGTMLAVGLRGQNVCCSCIRVVTAEKGVRTAWVLDAGKPVQATGLRFRADASRHYCRTPGAAQGILGLAHDRARIVHQQSARRRHLDAR